MKYAAVDITGTRFGRLVAVDLAYRDNRKRGHWNCKCDCGNHVVVRTDKLSSGERVECYGCRVKGARMSRAAQHEVSNLVDLRWTDVQVSPKQGVMDRHTMSVSQVAKLLGVGPERVRALDPDLRPIRTAFHNRARRYDPDVVCRFLDERTKRAD